MSYLCFYSPTSSTQFEPVVGIYVQTVQQCKDIDPDVYIAELASNLTQPSLNDIFAIPLAEDMAQMWALGFGLPMTCYLSAWGFGAVLNFIDKHKPY